MARFIFKKALCAFLAFSVISSLWAVPAGAAGSSDGKDAILAAAEYLGADVNGLMSSDSLIPGDSVSDWFSFALGRTGIGGGEKYLKGLEEEVTRRYGEEGGLSDKKATEWHRTALTVMALGGDPTRFGTDKSGNPIDLIKEGTYGWDRTDSFDFQGLNAWIFALITLDANDFEVPEDARFTKEAILEHILNAQDESGGFGLSGGANVDMTAMALQALAPYSGDKAKDAVSRAVDYLSSAQDLNGSFGGCAESTAQVIMALCGLGIDPENDERFIKDGGSALDGMRLFRLKSGMYCHTMGEEENLFSTKEAILAFISLDRMKGGFRGLYDMRPEPDGAVMPLYGFSGFSFNYYLLILPALIFTAAVVICVKKGKKKQNV